MGFLGTCFVVLMILAICGGGYGYRTGPGPWVWGGFLLWLCVAILGYIVLNGDRPPVPLR